MEQLNRVKWAIWYDFLSERYTYDYACELLQVLLIAKNALRKEGKNVSK